MRFFAVRRTAEAKPSLAGSGPLLRGLKTKVEGKLHERCGGKTLEWGTPHH